MWSGAPARAWNLEPAHRNLTSRGRRASTGAAGKRVATVFVN